MAAALATEVELDRLRTGSELSPRSTFLSHPISDDRNAQKAIIQGLWRLIEPSPRGLNSERERWAERLTNLGEYFEFYRQHFVDLEHLTGKTITVPQAIQIVVYWKTVLADNATISREALTTELASLQEHPNKAATASEDELDSSPRHDSGAETSDVLRLYTTSKQVGNTGHYQMFCRPFLTHRSRQQLPLPS